MAASPLPLALLDLAPITAGQAVRDSFEASVAVARAAERSGYQRVWYAEHHNMASIASSATSVLIGYIAAHTDSIRLGAGGIMLPNHSPLVIAEQFGTLATLFPGRIDLGLGRAPGSDPRTAQALRRNLAASADSFPQDVLELQSYFRPAVPGQRPRAVPGEGLAVPLWLLGSSLFSAQLAAALGLPFAFASHFAPELMGSAIELYREQFQPSEALARPHVMLGVNVFAADTDAEAARLFTSLQQQFVNLQRGTPGPLEPPVDGMEGRWTELERARLEHSLACSFIGSPATVRQGLERFLQRTGADELMVTAQIHDHAARLRSFELTAQVRDALAASTPAAQAPAAV